MTQLPQQNEDISQIAHYSILSCIGRGGMGLVYLARDTRLDRQVAIKCLRTELFEPHYRERFKREALLLAKLNHPNIVQIYDYVETDTQLALVMEYVAGQNLQQHLRENIVSLSQRMQWLTQIAQGLAIAHDAGIIHRDLKAENILINQHKLAKITDLGIAKSQDFNATLTDHVTGSYGSMSPEQAMGEELDFRSDLFSFGILAYQLLCGAHPFGETQNKLQLMQRIISHPPTAPTKNNPDLPQDVVELLGQLLSKNPDNRPANTHWVAAQCEKLYQLIAQNAVIDVDNTQMLPHANTSHSGIRKTDAHQSNSRYTQDHPTFETRFEKNKTPIIQRVKNYIQANSITVTCIGLAVAMVTGAIMWELRPKQPHYVAVLLPNLTVNGMLESQQELVKGAVYDAVQQSVLQLDGYYLIPQNEIADVNVTNNKEGIEAVRKATAADELIATDIQCKIEACTITLSRLTPESKSPESRLRVQDTKTVDVLTDNYLSMATIVQSNVGGLYSEEINNIFENIDEKDYAIFIDASRILRDKGANRDILASLDSINDQAKKIPAVQTLYKEIIFDLYHETKDSKLLEKLERFLKPNDTKNGNLNYLYNLNRLQVTKHQFNEADNTIEKIKTLNASSSITNELIALTMMEKSEYLKAIDYYKKMLAVKPTTNNFFNIANAYWYAGNTVSAKKYLTNTLELSPIYYKANTLIGLISLLEGDAESASKSFEKAIAKKPEDISNLSNLGLCYLLLGKYSQAKNLFNQASMLAPNFNTLILNKGDVENLAGNINESNEIYRKLIDSISPENISNENLRNRSQAYAHIGEYSKALSDLQQLEKIDSQNFETIYTAALVHTLASDKASAVLNIDQALKNGMNKIWFDFSWFDSLCSEKSFIDLMQNQGEPNRCTLPKFPKLPK